MDGTGGLILALAGVVGLVLWIAVKSRGQACPKCDSRRLETVEFLRRNPPPWVAYYRCAACGAELVQVGTEDFHDRIGSPHEHDPFWDPDYRDRSQGKPLKKSR